LFDASAEVGDSGLFIWSFFPLPFGCDLFFLLIIFGGELGIGVLDGGGFCGGDVI
jgi:hypothetical protein